ncbi:MAG: dienelactone hydrolase family protein [Anaerolineae bacterium]
MTLPYLIYPPGAGAMGEPAPLIVFLHGSGERGTDLAGVKVWGPLRYLDEGHTLPAYVSAPQCPLGVRWDDRLDELDRYLDILLRDHPIDPDRVLLTGFSMGGFGTWQWALRHPERFSALMPVAGSGFHFRDYRVGPDLSPLKHVPIWIFHGAQDEVVPVSGADEFCSTLLEYGASVGYTRYPHSRHTDTSDLVYWDTVHYDWLLKQKRQGQ